VKKILLINWRDIKNPEAGGAELYFHEIFKRLAAKGYSVTVLAHAFGGAPSEETVDGLTVIRRGGKFLFNYQIIPWLVTHHRSYDIVIEDLNKIPFFTLFYCRKPRLHLAMHFFGTEIFKEAVFPLALYVFLMERLAGFLYRREKFVAISESTAGDLVRFGVPRDTITIIEPGIDTTFFRPVCEKKRPAVIAHVGRLMKYKNVQFVITCLPELLKHAPDLMLHIGGSGDYRSALENLAASLGVREHVRFLGRISEEEKRELLSGAVMFVNPSAKEGWGINNIEANLCGTVSLSNNVHGLRDSVIDTVTGLLYQPDDRDDFVRKALILLTDDKARSRMEQAALKRAREDLDWETIASRMEAVLN